ncbi:MAG: hypothetical protein QOG64_1281, partial [Acidimicrobiaceae bacterium]|nr:hypothetical protein [Acidimicrobiaceae bacterium]
ALLASGMRAEHAEALLLAAQAALLTGRSEEALAGAAQAQRAFRRQRRLPWAAVAAFVELRARAAGAGTGPPSIGAVRRLASQLDAQGWPVPAADVRLTAAMLALRRGQPNLARQDLSGLSRLRTRGPVDLRVRAWQAEAQLRKATGDPPSALRAARRGLDLLAAHHAGLGATELRVHAAATGDELAALGTGLALATGSPAQVLAWAERDRQATSLHRAARPPHSPVLAAALSDLRRAAYEAESAAFNGAPPAPLLARQASLEQDVARLARQQRAGVNGQGRTRPGPTARGGPVPASVARARLGPGRCLVEVVEHERSLHAVVVTDRGMVLRAIGPSAPINGEATHLGFALRRLARDASPAHDGPAGAAAAGAAASGGTASGGTAAGAAAATGAAATAAKDALRVAATNLDDLLLAPIAADIRDRTVIISPSSALLNVPWAILPSCRERPVAVTPSASAWVAADAVARHRQGRPAVLVGGPDLDHADDELRAVARSHAGATTLRGPSATAPAVLAAARGAWLLHLAAHGEFRDDNPLFSSFWLADGPLSAYDLEGLRRSPAEVVLSACESAVSEVEGGWGRLGVASVLLGLGARNIVASVLPVPDRHVVALMADFHAGLGEGQATSAALAAAQHRALLASDEPGHLVAAAAFSCFGAG